MAKTKIKKKLNANDIVDLYMQPLDDEGNAQSVLITHGAKFRHCPSIGWLTWAGTHWEHDGGEAGVKRAITESIATRRWLGKKKSHKKDDQWDLIRKYCKPNKARVAGALYQLEAILYTSIEEFDTRPELINLTNGVYNLNKKIVEKHYFRAHMFTAVSNAEFNLDEECPIWLDFLNTTFKGDSEIIDYIQQLFGYCLSGYTTVQAFWLLIGDGANGKSVLLGVLSYLGGNYVRHLDSRRLSTANVNPEQTMHYLRGARVAISMEMRQGMKLDEPLVKAYTGNDEISARGLYQEPYTFIPTGKLLIPGNYYPGITGKDAGIWRRPRPIAFDNQISDSDANPNLSAELKTEINGILQWAIEGYEVYLKEGLLNTPKSILDATERYKKQQDYVMEFCEECLTPYGFTSVVAKDVFSAFTVWGEDNLSAKIKMNMPSLKFFYAELRRIGYSVERDITNNNYVSVMMQEFTPVGQDMLNTFKVAEAAAKAAEAAQNAQNGQNGQNGP